VIIREEDQNLLRVIAVVMIIEKVVILTEVMDITTIREKERVEVSLVVKQEKGSLIRMASWSKGAF